MTTKQDTLELYSFKIDEHAFDDELLYVIQMPEQWQQYFKSKQKKYNGFISYQMTIKPKQMEAYIYSLFQHVFNISWKSDPWLLATEQIDLDLIKEVCLSWFAKQENCTFNELPENLSQVELTQARMTFCEYKDLHPNTSIMYQWIPSLMAKRVERTYMGDRISFIPDYLIQFHHIYFNGRHECMSSLIQFNDKQDPFAYIIRFELKTRGLKPEDYIVNVSFHIRRFLTSSIKNSFGVTWNRSSSIIASLPNPYVHETKRQYITLKYKRNHFGIQWASDVDHLFSEFLIDRIEPKDVLQNVEQYLHNETIQLLAVYTDQIFTSNVKPPKVLPGVGLPEKTALFEDVKALFPELVPLPILPKVKEKILLGNQHNDVMYYGEVAEPIRFEVWGSKYFFDTVKEVLIDDKKGLLTKTDVENRFLLKDDRETVVEMVHLYHPEIIIEMPAKQQNREEKRIREIEQIAPKTSQITLAMVEIFEETSYKSKTTDPKNAIRQGLGRCQRLTQFLYPISAERGLNEKDKHRIHSGFSDLLTDYGYLPHFSKKLKRDDLFLSVDLLQMKKDGKRIFIPMMTKWDNCQLYVKFLGDHDWSLFRKALINLTQTKIMYFLRTETDVKRFRSFLKRTIDDELLQTEGRITLIIDAVLRSGGWYDPTLKRSGWLTITNEDLVSIELPFRNVNEEWKKRVRVVRVNSTNDNPQYQIVKQNNRAPNRRKGLFYDQHGIFYSVGSKPSTIRKPNALLKYGNPNTMILKQNIVEIIPLGVSDEAEATDLAEYVFHLRKLIIGYEVHTIQPYPLHMGKKVKKYLEKANVSKFDDWWNRTVDSTVIDDK